jgi:hypothetical protein
MEKASAQNRAKRKSVSQKCLFDRKNKAVRAEAEQKYGGGGGSSFPPTNSIGRGDTRFQG